MKKAALELLLIVVLFFSTWFALSRINWVALFQIEQLSQSTEQKLGELYWKLFSHTEKELQSKQAKKTIDTLVAQLCRANKLDYSKIKLHILEKDEVNAFTLPDNHLVVLTGLIAACENEAELTGILAHEIAHMEKNHVMKKLIKEVGLSVLISMTTGNGTGETIQNTARLLSSSAFDRDLEREADQTAVDYLLQAKTDPEPLANFLYRLGDSEKALPQQIFWITTHPDSKERAEAIIAYIKDKAVSKKRLLTPSQWQALQQELKATDKTL